jgi:hypothetical protein
MAKASAKTVSVKTEAKDTNAVFNLTLEQVADMAGVKESRVSALRRAEFITSQKKGRQIFYSERSVEEVVECQKRGVKIPATAPKSRRPVSAVESLRQSAENLESEIEAKRAQLKAIDKLEADIGSLEAALEGILASIASLED